MPVPPRIDTYDWQEAFGFAYEPDPAPLGAKMNLAGFTEDQRNALKTSALPADAALAVVLDYAVERGVMELSEAIQQMGMK